MCNCFYLYVCKLAHSRITSRCPQARYSMGSKKVSCLQYDLHSKDEALVHVGVYNDDGPPTFRITTDSPAVETQQEVVRRRQTASSNTDTGGDSSRVQDVELKEFGGGDCATRKRDPIKWFGVLVPQPLRESQRRFSSCAELCCELATLKAKLMQQQQEFQGLMKRKVDMIAN